MCIYLSDLHSLSAQRDAFAKHIYTLICNLLIYICIYIHLYISIYL